MIIVKKRFLVLCVLFSAIHGAQTDFLLDDDCVESVTVIEHKNHTEEQQIQDEAAKLLLTKAPPTVECLDAVLLLTSEPLELQSILQFSFYTHTNPIVIRPLQDEPNLQLPIPEWGKHEAALMPFVYVTNRAYYTKNGTYIKDYAPILGDKRDDFLENIDDALLSPKVPQILELFNPLKLEHRRAGAMLAYSATHHHWTVSAAWPLYYQELNFQLTKKEKDLINQADFFTGFAFGSTPDSVERFTYQHLAADRFGFGDLRLRGWYTASGENGAAINVGAELTLPAAITIKRGLMFGAFNPSKAPPRINFAEILALIEQSNSGDPIEAFKGKAASTELYTHLAVSFLDRLSTALCNRSLGQEHVSLGPLLRIVTPTSHWGAFELYGACDYFAPAKEMRMLNPIKRPAQFDRDWTNDNMDIACANLEFLNQEATNSLYPPFVCVKVRPGIVYKGSLQWSIDRRWYHLNAGADFWGQTKEKIYPNTLTQDPQSPLDIKSATVHAAHQTKLFGGLMLKQATGQHFFNVGLKGDFTVQTSGMGKEWGVVIYLSVKF